MARVCQHESARNRAHFFFFFQAEDGIRDYRVTGVQTCALPIYTGANTTSTPLIPRASPPRAGVTDRSEEHTSELQSHDNLVCRLLLEKTNHKEGSFFLFRKGDWGVGLRFVRSLKLEIA